MSTRKRAEDVSSASFEAVMEARGGDVTVSVRGDIDDASADRLDAALEEARRAGGHLTLDLTGAWDVGSRAVETLQHHGAQLSARGHGFTLRAIAPMADHLLRLGLGDLLGVRRRRLGLQPVVLRAR